MADSTALRFELDNTARSAVAAGTALDLTVTAPAGGVVRGAGPRVVVDTAVVAVPDSALPVVAPRWAVTLAAVQQGTGLPVAVSGTALPAALLAAVLRVLR